MLFPPTNNSRVGPEATALIGPTRLQQRLLVWLRTRTKEGRGTPPGSLRKTPVVSSQTVTLIPQPLASHYPLTASPKLDITSMAWSTFSSDAVFRGCPGAAFAQYACCSAIRRSEQTVAISTRQGTRDGRYVYTTFVTCRSLELSAGLECKGCVTLAQTGTATESSGPPTENCEKALSVYHPNWPASALKRRATKPNQHVPPLQLYNSSHPLPAQSLPAWRSLLSKHANYSRLSSIFSTL